MIRVQEGFFKTVFHFSKGSLCLLRRLQIKNTNVKYHATESTKDYTHSSTAVYLSSMQGPGLLPSTIIKQTKHTGFITHKEQRALNIKYDLNKKSQRLSSLTFAEKLIKSPVKKMVRTWSLKQTKNWYIYVLHTYINMHIYISIHICSIYIAYIYKLYVLYI